MPQSLQTKSKLSSVWWAHLISCKTYFFLFLLASFCFPTFLEKMELSYLLYSNNCIENSQQHDYIFPFQKNMDLTVWSVEFVQQNWYLNFPIIIHILSRIYVNLDEYLNEAKVNSWQAKHFRHWARESATVPNRSGSTIILKETRMLVTFHYSMNFSFRLSSKWL